MQDNTENAGVMGKQGESKRQIKEFIKRLLKTLLRIYRTPKWRRYLNDERLYASFPSLPQEKQKVFAKYVKVIELEVFSYCNRTCWFCPNTYIDRRSENIFMPPEIYSKIIEELAEIDYSGIIWYGRYNEPFADPVIFDRVREARKKLPNATLKTYSNGDYITTELLDRAVEAGLNEIYIMRYPSLPDKHYSPEEVTNILESFATKVSLPFRKIEDDVIHLLHPTLKLEVRHFSLSTAHNRAGALKLAETMPRTLPCSLPFVSIVVDHNCKVMPCCHTRSDVQQHAEMIMGDVAKNTLYEIYTNLHYSLLRYQMRDTGVKSFPCSACNCEYQSFYSEVPK
jgi:MoaA/NifB/PqqE/SkfB family radical SAM enzyme